MNTREHNLLLELHTVLNLLDYIAELENMLKDTRGM